MKLSLIDPKDLDDSMVEKILFSIPTDDLEDGDCILVFGSYDFYKERMDKAIDLYYKKRAPKILLSGGFGKRGVEKEAVIMKNYAIDKGIPASDILIEDESNNTMENVLYSLLVLYRDDMLPGMKRLLIVTSPAHIKRCMLTLSRYMPHYIEYSYCYDENSILSKKNWKNDLLIRKKFFTEVINMIKYAQDGIIDDIEIDI